MTDNTLQKQLYGVAIFEEEIVLSDFSDNIERRYVVTPDQLMGFFQTEAVFLPFPGLIWLKSSGCGETCLITLPAGPRTILYKRGGKKKKTEAIPLRLPSLAVIATTNGTERTITGIDIWGFSGRTLQDETVLYELPLPNLTGASMCLGSTQRAHGRDVRAAVETTIFDTPFNHHNNIVGAEGILFHDYAKKYHGTCPLRTLKKIGSGNQLLENRI